MPLTLIAPLGNVLTDAGRVDAKKLAHELDMTIPKIAPALGKSARWLNENPTAPSIQAAALQLVDAMNALADSLGGLKFANAWLKTPTDEFAKRSPAEVLQREPNGLEAVIGLIDAIVSGEPG